MGGKLKISGNVMASQKLVFLKKRRPEGGDGRHREGAAAAPAPAALDARSRRSGGSRGKVRWRPRSSRPSAERLAKTPGLAAEIGAVIQFVVKNPDERVDARPRTGAGTVSEGKRAASPTTTLTLADEDLAALVEGARGRATSTSSGKLRVDGDVRPAAQARLLQGSRLSAAQAARKENAMGRRVNVIGVGMTKFAKPGASEDYHVMATQGGAAPRSPTPRSTTPTSSRRTPATSTATARAASARSTRWASPASRSST